MTSAKNHADLFTKLLTKAKLIMLTTIIGKSSKKQIESKVSLDGGVSEYRYGDRYMRKVSVVLRCGSWS